MEPNQEEMQALIEYHRTQQYEYARREDYNDAEYSKNRAQEWSTYAASVLKPFVVEPK